MKIIDASNKNSFVLNGKTYHIKKENTQINESMELPKGIVFHHTGGQYSTIYDLYHFNVAFIDNEPIVIKTLEFNQKGQHLWGRNSGHIGITFNSLATPKQVPKPEQLDLGALLGAEICAWKRIDPKGTHETYNPNSKVLLKDAPNVTDHAYYAQKDKYDRWDIGDKKQIVINKLDIYYKELKSGKRKFQFLELLKE